MSRQAHLEACVANVVNAAPLCELVGIERVYTDRGGTLRIYVDKPGGITIGECALLSRRIGTMLLVECPADADMSLEVSSPGLDRRIFTAAQAQAFIGREVDVSLSVSLQGRKHIVGVLKAVTESVLNMGTETESWDIPFEDVSVARLVPNI